MVIECVYVCAEHCTTDGQLLPQLGQLDPELINRVLNDVVEDCQSISWDSIVGLESVKQLIQCNMVLPIHYPHLFKVHTIFLKLCLPCCIILYYCCDIHIKLGLHCICSVS